MTHHVVPLGPDTWPQFAELVERNNGVYGGCWCIAFHAAEHRQGDHRATKEALVRSGDAHAALVVDEDGVAHGWAQYGRPAELDGINHRRAYDKEPPPVPDWRIACVFVDRARRGEGVARAAAEGALDLIAAAGGGLVEVIAETTDGRTAQSRFLLSATVELWEDLGFTRVRQVGKHAWIVNRTIGA